LRFSKSLERFSSHRHPAITLRRLRRWFLTLCLRWRRGGWIDVLPNSRPINFSKSSLVNITLSALPESERKAFGCGCNRLLSAVILLAPCLCPDNWLGGNHIPRRRVAMHIAYRIIAVSACLLASLCAGAQAGAGIRKIVLPNPQLIHCRSAECSQLWKQDSGDGGVVYPAQVFTDFVNGEVVGLTAAYDKSVSERELHVAINTLYEKWERLDLKTQNGGVWRVEPEQIVIQLSERKDGTKQLIYLKVSNGMTSRVPSAHICSE
jgi:hypothetical protein